MNDMIERVARAVCTVLNCAPCACTNPDPEHCGLDLEVARAAIEAIRPAILDNVPEEILAEVVYALDLAMEC